MTIEEYKQVILHHLETANDCEEVELIIVRSIERMKEKHLPGPVIDDYLAQLKHGLKELTPGNFDDIHWCNIKCAILVLKKVRNQ
jgi:hypothetical protein